MMRSCEVPVEDRKFLHILEKKAVTKDDHYLGRRFQMKIWWWQTTEFRH